jgi:hypothetical protein
MALSSGGDVIVTGEGGCVPAAADPRLLEDYKIHVQALTNQYGRMWTRFNFFITIHTALMVALIGLFKDEGAAWAALAIPLLGALMSGLWYVTGAQDRYLVRFYREMISHAARRLAPEDADWAHPGVDVDDAVRALADGKEPRPAGYDKVSDAEAVLGLSHDWWQWRNPAISITKLPAMVPAVIGALWLMAAVGLALAAAL